MYSKYTCYCLTKFHAEVLHTLFNYQQKLHWLTVYTHPVDSPFSCAVRWDVQHYHSRSYTHFTSNCPGCNWGVGTPGMFVSSKMRTRSDLLRRLRMRTPRPVIRLLVPMLPELQLHYSDRLLVRFTVHSSVILKHVYSVTAFDTGFIFCSAPTNS